jgi:hypothetical protein
MQNVPSVPTIKLCCAIRAFLVSCGFAHAREVSPHACKFTLWMIRSFEFKISAGCVTELKIVSRYNTVRAPRLTLKWARELQADALHRGNNPHTILYLACVCHALQ